MNLLLDSLQKSGIVPHESSPSPRLSEPIDVPMPASRFPSDSVNPGKRKKGFALQSQGGNQRRKKLKHRIDSQPTIRRIYAAGESFVDKSYILRFRSEFSFPD